MSGVDAAATSDAVGRASVNGPPSPYTRQKMPYLPGLDGVRAIAVCAVLLFHLPAQLLPGGFLGVDAFFVLSGFLITTILLEEVEGTDALRFGRFYLRRARRLLPALLAVLAFTALLSLTVARDAASQFRQDLLSALTYTTNWWYIFDDRSYFEAIGRPPMLQHLWSLAVEEQFYLIWPTVLFVAWRLWGRRGVGYAALSGAVLSTAWMATLATVNDIPAATDTARIYFGADTHAMTVMAGAALAVVWRPSRLPRVIPQAAQRVLALLGGASIVAMAWFFLELPENSAWLYRGGFLVFAIATAGLVVAASHPAGRFATALGNPVMRWLGTRSYGIYLWHWPVFLVTRPALDLPYGGWAAAVTSLALTGLFAEVSYRWLEMPIRRGALGRSWNLLRAGDAQVRYRWIGVGAASLLTVVLGGVALAAVPTVDSTTYLGGVSSVGGGELQPKQDVTKKGNEPGHGDSDQSNLPLTERRVSVVGDSVALSARTAILERFPNARFDAVIGRQPYDTIERVRERRRLDKLADLLVLQTGTNGIPPMEDLRSMLIELDDLDGVVVVNVRAQVPWMDQSNTALQKASQGLDHVVLVDWAALSADRGGYFEKDGTHLTPSGAAAYARAVFEGLQIAVDRTDQVTD